MSKFKPILMSGTNVKAIQEDRKTQTRRIINPQPEKVKDQDGLSHLWIPGIGALDEFIFKNKKMKIHKGDILWVRETWKESLSQNSKYIYKADSENNPNIYGHHKWKPSIFMPKAACRLFLEVINVRVERLQDISEQDAIAEGVESYKGANDEFKSYSYKGENLIQKYPFLDPTSSFCSLWISINGKESWAANPWVWVYDFKKIEKPENFI